MTQLHIPKHLETAYVNGFSYKDKGDNIYRLYSYEIGNLIASEGSIIACDPFLFSKAN